MAEIEAYIMKIGILGGTFNPIHIGHINIAEAALKECNLDEVWFMPNGKPPHKDIPGNITNMERLEMVRLAISDNPLFKVCDIEINRKKPGYSYVTFQELHEIYKDQHEFYFIVGEDSFWNFTKWVKPEEICKYTKIIVAKRPNWAKQEMLIDESTSAKCIDFANTLQKYKEMFHQDFIPLHVKEIDIASSELRRDIYNRNLLKQYVPQKALNYIYNVNLYQHHHELYEIGEIDKKVKKALKTNRYEHTIGVMHTAANLAYAYEYPYVNAMIAGLLHDCAKCISDEERIDVCKTHGISISDIEARYPHLLHGKVGSVYAKEKYEINDEDILHAITWHTTGCPNMSLLDKIIYVADYIEPGRDKAPRLDEIRHMAYINIDRCIYMILQDSVEYLSKNTDSMDETTLETYQYFKKLVEGKTNDN